MNGAHSRRNRAQRRRSWVAEKASIPLASQTKTRSCEVGTPTLAAITAERRSHSPGTSHRLRTAQVSHYTRPMPSVEALEVASPYSGEIVGRVPKGGADEARAAVDAAANALREPLPAHERARILDRAAHLLEERHDEAARLISSEAGKPMKAARVE